MDSAAAGPGVGDACTSSLGEPGEIYSACGSDDAFCEPTDSGTVCFGYRPFECPEGQVRLDWRSCGYAEDVDGVGGEGADGEGDGNDQLGEACTSSQNESGVIVRNQSGCLLDDAFCEATDSGTYCTGSRPFVCPEGQVRVSWTSCGFPEGLGGAGGVGGAGGAP